MSQENVDLVSGLHPGPDVDTTQMFRDDDAWAAVAAAVHGSIRLDSFVDECCLAGLHRAAECAHHTAGQRGLKAEGIADSENLLSDLQRGGIA